ncbi:hypothetical protein [Kitasatospora atroaurantiaca]|uniref:Uncharacterized protein n=1 Tax=Kitasatospora atroaurantiaca TaxID=285545 RepID=A0A561F1V4_9ACTN|nr:hypothetical protein [Kitasatospora atroaurantiaca]TWE21846.1 hypothetical protein FB465_7080 [Kitasatospora atroaurantiaca]
MATTAAAGLERARRRLRPADISRSRKRRGGVRGQLGPELTRRRGRGANWLHRREWLPAPILEVATAA